MTTTQRRRVVVDDSALAAAIGGRIRAARLKAGMTQQQVAGDRYTKAYISALEKGHAKPSMAALQHISGRLGLPSSHFLIGEEPTRLRWGRLEADLALASSRWQDAADAYAVLLDGPADEATRAELLHGQAEALCRLNRPLEAIAAATPAVRSFKAVGRERDAALATYWLAYGMFLSENITESRALLQALLDSIRGGLEVEPDFEVRVLMAISAAASRAREHPAALAYLEEARALAGDLDDRRRASFLSMLATSYAGAGDLEAAITTGTKSLALYRAAEGEREAATVQNNLALAYLAIGNADRASELAASARATYERLGERRHLAHVVETQSRLALAGDDNDAGLRYAEEAIGIASETGNWPALANASVARAQALRGLGRTDDAIDGYRNAADVAREHGVRGALQQALSEWADALAEAGRHEEAYALSREALAAGAPPQFTSRAGRAEPAR
jgi:transcriptional regulator with XRE-family HTH domain